jgi:hypothetical protein
MILKSQSAKFNELMKKRKLKVLKLLDHYFPALSVLVCAPVNCNIDTSRCSKGFCSVDTLDVAQASVVYCTV